RMARIWWKRGKETLRHRQNRRRKNHRDHTAHIELQRHRRLRTADDLSTDVTFCVTDGDLSSRRLDKNDESDDANQRYQHRDHADRRHRVATAETLSNLLHAT